jgi:hypothetical protein
MTKARRKVWVGEDFLLNVDLALDGSGEMKSLTSHEFLSVEVPRIVEEFATQWESLPMRYQGHPGYRLLVQRGSLVFAHSTVGRLTSEDSIELISVRIDLEGPIDPDTDSNS